MSQIPNNTHHPDKSSIDHSISLTERAPTASEIREALEEGYARGLPESWQVSWDRRGRKTWTLDGKHVYSIPHALAYSVKIGLLSPEKLPPTHQDKELTKEQVEEALRKARAQGLPDGFTVQWDNHKRRRIWKAPDGTPIKGGIPAALKVAAEMGLIPQESIVQAKSRNLTAAQRTEFAHKEARAKGLPEGWTVVFDEKYNQLLWKSPDGERKVYGIDKALAYSVKKGWLPADRLPNKFRHDRELTPSEKSKAWKEAKQKGLPETWTVIWDSKQNRRVWVAPDDRRCDCISKALAYSVRKGWLKSDKLPRSHKADMTPEEIQEALSEAKERGLPEGWKVKWNSKKHQKQWIAPKTGKICSSIPDALNVSVKLGLLKEMPPKKGVKRKRSQTRIIGPLVHRQPHLDPMVDAALVNDLQRLVDQDEVDDNGENFEWHGYGDDPGVNVEQQQPAAALAPIRDPTESSTRVMSQLEIDAAVEEAKARGLPEGWRPYWDAKRKRRRWVSPCGKHKCKGIPSALRLSVSVGMISKDKVPPSADKRSPLSPEMREAIGLQEARERGLPSGWKCKWSLELKARRWISPDGRIAKTLNEALRMSVDMGLLPRSKLPPEFRERVLTDEEQAFFLQEAQAKGLPSGWSVSWNSKRRQKIWISPDGKSKCDSLPKALNTSVRLGLISRDKLPPAFQERVLTQEEIQAALEEARTQGLPEGWKVEWNSKKGCRRWISPDNKRRCECISKAIEYSVKMGWVKEDGLPSVASTPRKRRRKGGEGVGLDESGTLPLGA
eukprot:scaffold10700_cov108-Cylindrotheca_fusiformis.AAC.3